MRNGMHVQRITDFQNSSYEQTFSNHLTYDKEYTNEYQHDRNESKTIKTNTKGDYADLW